MDVSLYPALTDSKKSVRKKRSMAGEQLSVKARLVQLTISGEDPTDGSFTV